MAIQLKIFVLIALILHFLHTYWPQNHTPILHYHPYLFILQYHLQFMYLMEGKDGFDRRNIGHMANLIILDLNIGFIFIMIITKGS